MIAEHDDHTARYGRQSTHDFTESFERIYRGNAAMLCCSSPLLNGV
jgi:hypothetical protein